MGSLKGIVANLSKNKLLEAEVLESVGDHCSIQLVGNGRKLVGVRYTGGPVVAGQKVLVDYISGKPVAYAMGQEQVTQSIPRVINRASPVTDAGQATTGGEGTGIVPEHYLGNHLDVFIDIPLDGQALVYSSGSNAWVNGSSGSEASLSFSDAEGDPVDVDATAAADGTSIYATRRDHRHHLGAHTHTRQAMYLVTGTLVQGAGAIRLYNNLGVTLTISKVFIAVNTAPTGADILIDVHKDGTTIFTNQAHRPTITASSFTGETTTIDVSSWAADEYLTIDIDQIGSTIAGADLTVSVVCS